MREVPAKKYRTRLASDERSDLEEIRDRGSNKSARFKRALALLMCGGGTDGAALTSSPNSCFPKRGHPFRQGRAVSGNTTRSMSGKAV
jgi:hypothetical protein